MSQNTFKYPDTKKVDVIDKHGLKDPYRWLEDTEKCIDWVKDQNQITNEFLNRQINKQEINKKLSDIYNYEKYGAPFKRGNNYYYYKNDGLQNQYVLYTKKTLDSEASVFLDPNLLSVDGTTSLSSSAFSRDGKKFAYTVNRAGSDWQTAYIKDVESKCDLKDVVEFIKFSGISWTSDNLGFFYCKYPRTEKVQNTEDQKAGTETDAAEHQKVYYHTMGDDQHQDTLIYEFPDDSKLMFGATVSEDGKYLILTTQKGCETKNLFFIADLQNFQNNKQLSFQKVVSEFFASFEYITNDDDIFYLTTNFNAPKNKIISIDINNSAQENWITIVDEKQEVLNGEYAVDDDKLLLVYQKDVHDEIKLFNLKNGQFICDINLPTVGTVSIGGPKRNQNELFYMFSSFLIPSTIYRYDYSQKESTLLMQTKINGFDPTLFECNQIFYQNKQDHTKIPMFIIKKKSLNDQQPKPFYLYGYGGFNISITPSFNPLRIILMQNLGINVAIANIRGGGEYGEEWHQQGTKERKQNVFNDFCSAAEYLIENNYTTSNQLAIAGGSNGGLLVAACANQRPELFKAIVAQVGVMDMLRFHLFTIGHAWTSDYGCADNEDDFKYLIKYSPIHNVQSGKPYPAILVTTADHDDRVVPLHSYKYISTIQDIVGKQDIQTEPLLIRIEEKAGHGAGKPTAKVIAEVTDVYCFLSLVLNTSFKE